MVISMIFHKRGCKDIKDKDKSYFIEEDENLMIRRILNLKILLIAYVCALAFFIALLVLFVYMIIEKGAVFYKVVGVISILLIAAFAIIFLKCLVGNLQYLLLIDNQGIKNRAFKGEIILSWEEIKKIGIIYNIMSRKKKCTYIYISNSDLDESRIRKILTDRDPDFYITNQSEALIAIRLTNQEEAQALYLKIQEYSSKFYSQNN